MVINKRGVMALSQILILIIGIVAISWSIGVVNALEEMDSFGPLSGDKSSVNVRGTGPPIPTPSRSDPNNFIRDVSGLEKALTKEQYNQLSPEIKKLYELQGGGVYGLKKAATITETPPAGTGLTGIFSSIFGIQKGGWWDGIISGAAWAGTVYTLTQFIGGFFTDNQAAVDAASMALGGGRI